MKPKEPMYQVALDALALTTCYTLFLITTKVPVIYMHQLWATVTKHKSSYRFKIDNKKFSVNVEVFRDILNICLRIQDQVINVIVDHLHQPWRTFASIINKCLCGKVSGLDKIQLSRVQILYGILITWTLKQDKTFYPRFKKIIIHHFLDKDKSISMRNRTFMHTAHDDSLLGAEPLKLRKSQKKSDSAILSEESPSKKKSTKAKKVAATKPKPTKKKAPVKADRCKGLNVLFEVALSEADHLKKAIERSKKDSHASHPCSSSIDERTDKSISMRNRTFMHTAHDDSLLGTMRFISRHADTQVYGAIKPYWTLLLIRLIMRLLQEAEPPKLRKSQKKSDSAILSEESNLRNEDAKMTDGDQTRADQQNVSQESGFEQVEEDAHVTLTLVINTQKTDDTMQSSSVSSDFTRKLLNLENPSPADNEIASLMDTTVSTTSFPALPDFASVFKFNERVTNLEKDLSEIKQVNQYAKVLSSIPTINNVAKSLEAAILTRSTSQPKSTYEAASSLSEFELTNILINKMDKNKSYDKDDYKRELYDALIKSYETDKDLFNSYDQGTKRRKLSKDVESSRDSRSKEKKSSTISKDASHSQHKSFGKSAHAEEPSHTVKDSGVQHDQEFFTGDNDEQPVDKEVTKADWFKKPEQPPTPDLD
ncbi:hypothetical protein Tco_0418591 [Tanacetum coccineum]